MSGTPESNGGGQTGDTGANDDDVHGVIENSEGGHG